tara:strand:- start:216 stop:623 length:408 start_codon:yes stop_codon:yes gene_type:complete
MKKILILLLVIVVLGCSKNEGTPIWRIWYAVQVTPNYDLSITYNSDKYFDSGKRDSVFVNDTSYSEQLDGFWVGQRLQDNKDDGYYINVQLNELDEYEGYLGVFVYVNDTNLIDSVLYPYGTSEITLQGEIPVIF